jgi:hypothetical protein
MLDKVEGKDKGKARKPPALSIVDDSKVVSLARGQGKDVNGLTAKQEAFCQGVGARGETLAAAYRAAYDASNMTQHTIHNEACKLMSNPAVAARVNALVAQKQASVSHDATRIRSLVIERLHLEAQNPKNPPSVRVRSLELLGKLDVVGMFKDRAMVESEHAPSADLAATLQSRLTALLGKAS